MTEREAKLDTALRRIMQYRAHLRGCAVDDTEFCTCGLREAADAARAALNTPVMETAR